MFAIIAIFLKDFIKKRRRNKVTSKNNYDQRRTNRYKRKLGLRNEEIVEVEADGIETPTAEDKKPESEETVEAEETADVETPDEVTGTEETSPEEASADENPEEPQN